LTGFATVTCGGAGGAVCASGCVGPQPVSAGSSKSNMAGKLKRLGKMDFGMRFSV
jgi:hypothetical protein